MDIYDIHIYSSVFSDVCVLYMEARNSSLTKDWCFSLAMNVLS